MQSVETKAWEQQRARLWEALKRDEFELYCQPIVPFARPGDWQMAEVLIRLRQEERALLPPGEFLPAFEHFGMMPQLDSWVLRRVISHHLAGSKARQFSINVSGQTLEHAGFVKLFADLASSSGVKPASVLFEIEESDILARQQEAERFAAAIHAAGGRIVVDGFGSRSISFALLKALQADYVKVDGAVTRRVAHDESCALKLKSIRRAAQMLGIGVIAECVESSEVLARLEAIGIGFAQGYGICRPRPIEELPLRELAVA